MSPQNSPSLRFLLFRTLASFLTLSNFGFHTLISRLEHSASTISEFAIWVQSLDVLVHGGTDGECGPAHSHGTLVQLLTFHFSVFIICGFSHRSV